MKLEIISPEKTLYAGQAEMITLPGSKGAFTILERHASIISSLDKGSLVYRRKEKEVSLEIKGGFVEAKNNIVTVCVE
jgi:F-type H+-transporting ATPase subunit epsilon